MTQPSRFVLAVLDRPQMYTTYGTFEETVAFLDGYFSGISIANTRNAEAQIWADFKRYLSREFSVASHEVYSHLHDSFDQESMSQLRACFAEYIKQ